jgi:hypothetical protein
MPTTHSTEGGAHYIEQSWEDLAALNEILGYEGGIADIASWLMSAYYSELHDDSGNTFGDIKAVFVHGSGPSCASGPGEAGFVFEDSDSHEWFEVRISPYTFAKLETSTF